VFGGCRNRFPEGISGTGGGWVLRGVLTHGSYYNAGEDVSKKMDESICSEEIGDDGAVVDAVLAFFVFREDYVFFLLGRIEFQETGEVVTSVAVVGC
jgi:hypothetical protein